MSRKELIVIVSLIIILITLVVVNYIKRENLKKSYVILVEEAAIQVSINSADVDELEELPGIGSVLAHRIVEYRNKNGRFVTLEDLKRVKGVGDNLYQNILPHIKL